jgi:hypothetical protein
MPPRRAARRRRRRHPDRERIISAPDKGHGQSPSGNRPSTPLSGSTQLTRCRRMPLPPEPLKPKQLSLPPSRSFSTEPPAAACRAEEGSREPREPCGELASRGRGARGDPDPSPHATPRTTPPRARAVGGGALLRYVRLRRARLACAPDLLGINCRWSRARSAACARGHRARHSLRSPAGHGRPASVLHPPFVVAAKGKFARHGPEFSPNRHQRFIA